MFFSRSLSYTICHTNYKGIYIYIYRERERERESKGSRTSTINFVCMCKQAVLCMQEGQCWQACSHKKVHRFDISSHLFYVGMLQESACVQIVCNLGLRKSQVIFWHIT